MSKKYHNKHKKPLTQGGAKVAKKLDRSFGGSWWSVKKVLLVCSAIAVGAGLVQLAFGFSDSNVLKVVIGVIAGLVLLYWTLHRLSRYRVSVTQAVFIPMCAVVYVILAFTYLS